VTRHNHRCTLTELQHLELLAWYKAKLSIGSFKSKANELGVPIATVRHAVQRMLEREVSRVLRDAGLRRGYSRRVAA
jgi:hypothetical protein